MAERSGGDVNNPDQLSLITAMREHWPVADLPSDDAIPAPVCPGNESREHWFLKHLARNYWMGRDGICAAVEVYVVFPEARRSKGRVIRWSYGGIVDVMALRYPRRDRSPSLGKGPPVSVSCEVKVSRPDYLSGYIDDACDVNYVVTQPDIITRDDLPPHVGWLLYDPTVRLSLRVAKRPKQVAEPMCNADDALQRIVRTLTGELMSRRDLFDADPFAERAVRCPYCRNRSGACERCRGFAGGKVCEDYTQLTRKGSAE